MVTRGAGGEGPKRRVEAIVNDHLSESFGGYRGLFG
jgi:hypothetical protein